MSRNAITDVPGVLVGHAQDAKIASGVTAVLFDAPCVASVAIGGGAPAARDIALLQPGMTVESVDALVLSGGSAFGLDAMGGVQAYLRERGRGFRVGDVCVPIVPGSALFDLANGGDKDWGVEPIYWRLGYVASAAASRQVALGSVGAGLGATTATLKGGLGSASAATTGGFLVGAIVAVNALGSATIGEGPHFWAAPYEHDGEFGGLGMPHAWDGALAFRIKGAAPQNTTIGIVATDAALTRPQAMRLAVMAQGGLSKALRPALAALDGDTVYAAATARAAAAPTPVDLAEIGTLAADCLARAIARAIYEAAALPFAGAQPSWRDRFGQARSP